MKARELMTENPECVTENDTVERAAQLMRDLNVGLIPVVDDARSLRGVITDLDIAMRHVGGRHLPGAGEADHVPPLPGPGPLGRRLTAARARQ